MGRTSALVGIITSDDPAIRDRSLEGFCRQATAAQLLDECRALDAFRRQAANLYERVRACFFLYAIHRFHLPSKPDLPVGGKIPYQGYTYLLERRFEEAIDSFLDTITREGPSDGVSSALSEAYHKLGFQTLADQVRRSVRSVRGNQWMFRMGHPADHPLRIHPALLAKDPSSGVYPVLRERTPVRMDLSHSGWSDIFFLGMDYPEGARVLNVSIDLAVRGRDNAPAPPVEAYLRVIDEPIIRLLSVDLGARADISSLAEIFDFAKDYLGLLKAALIAAGIVPPGIEGAQQSLKDLLARQVGPGKGLELVSHVRDIPKGSRLAVSTSLLAALIAACMRATRQTRSLTGPLEDHERRLVAARAILGEWLGGSGGGWQDSGGVWPGIKLIYGVPAGADDPEHGVSRGRLLPNHRIMGEEEVTPATRQALQDSLVLVHGGMAQNVGPILEMVTEKYLLRSEAEWQARQEAMRILEVITGHLQGGNVHAIGRETSRNFRGPIQTIIPWTTNLFTETIIDRVRAEMGDAFWGFWMLGGMSGGGMGFIFHPDFKARAQNLIQEVMSDTKHRLQSALPFAMEPVVYDFAINENGTMADLLAGEKALLPAGYYPLILPELVQQDRLSIAPARRAEMSHFTAACRTQPELSGMMERLLDAILPHQSSGDGGSGELSALLEQHGFDRVQHEEIRAELRAGRIGLAQNRLPVSTEVLDVQPGDVYDAITPLPQRYRDLGLDALREGSVAVVSLAGGVGSRWTQGAGTVKALHPFCRLAGKHRSFVETHLAKSRRIARLTGTPLPHVFTTSYLTYGAIANYLAAESNYGYEGPLLLSEGRAIGLRVVPMTRDLRFAWKRCRSRSSTSKRKRCARACTTPSSAGRAPWVKAVTMSTTCRSSA